MDTKTILVTAGATLARSGVKYLAAFLVGHGLLAGGNTEAFTGLALGLLAEGWSLWDSHGRAIAMASLDILRAKVIFAAAKARANPTLAVPVLTDLDAHVTATTPAAAPIAPPAAALILLAIGLAALALGWATPADAQTPPRRPVLTGDPVRDIGAAINQAPAPAAKPNPVEALLAKPFQDLANFIADDSDAAITLSTQIPELQDGHGQQCWMATRQFGAVIKAHPVPLTLKAQTDLEALRLLMMAANNLCANVHCTQVFGDLANGIQTLAPLNASIPIPSLHDICSKIPQIAVAPPVAVPAPAAPAAPAP